MTKTEIPIFLFGLDWEWSKTYYEMEISIWKKIHYDFIGGGDMVVFWKIGMIGGEIGHDNFFKKCFGRNRFNVV